MSRTNARDRARMTNEQILRWLIEFGSGPVHIDELFTTWANDELNWAENTSNGWLDRDLKGYKLSDEAIRRLKK